MYRLSLVLLLCGSALAFGQGKAPTAAAPDLSPVLRAAATSWQAGRYLAVKPEFAIADIERDFHAMRSLDERAWPSEETRSAWASYWQALGEAQQRGQLRATNLSLIVPAPERSS